MFGTETVLPSEYIALDLEYDSNPNTRAVYLAGVATVTAAGTTTHSLWADLGRERDLLDGLAAVLAEHPELPVMTWNGRSADGDQLRKACLAAGFPSMWEEFEARHIDLYQVLLRTVRFPTRGLEHRRSALLLPMVVVR